MKKDEVYIYALVIKEIFSYRLELLVTSIFQYEIEFNYKTGKVADYDGKEIVDLIKEAAKKEEPVKEKSVVIKMCI